ncbi:MAG TPA: FUSC family protein [Gammaproteobacteria bacterium]|nr:FUSC family protein [Gammaproteobacteria bacterium]
MANPLTSGTWRIAFSAALRGTAAAAAAFLLLRQAGQPAGALFATIAVLNLSIADSGGPYRQRLAVMLAIALIVPLILVAGMQARQLWWLAVVLMFAVALAGGMARLFGAAGTSIGLIAGIVFVVGLEIPADLLHSLYFAGYYLAGALWTILVALAVWRLRPYRRVRYEIGECFRQLGVTLNTLRARGGEDDPAREAELVARRQRVKGALDQAGQSLGTALGASGTPPPFLSDLIVLLRAASRIDAVAAGLGGALSHPDTARLSPGTTQALRSLLQAFEILCAAIGTALLDRAPAPDMAPVYRRLDEWQRSSRGLPDSAPLEEIGTFVNVITRQLETARRVADRLSGIRAGPRGLLPPLNGPAFPDLDPALVRANLSFRSLVFRHALRVAFATAAGTAIYLLLHVPHGIWIPLTVLIVLQPQLGATLSRALQRTGGTLLGALLAGLLIFLFHGSVMLDAAILACLFLTLLLFRQRYWLAVVFLTPLIILLLTLMTHQPWAEIVNRIGDTLAGAVLALVAGYALWPSWEYRWLPDQVADGVQANREYLAALLAATVRGLEPDWPLAGLRARVELTASNARASLERMLMEPRRVRWQPRDAMAMVTHLERLGRHISRLSIYLHETPGRIPPLGELTEAFDRALRSIEDALRDGRYPPADDSLEHAWLQLQRTGIGTAPVGGPNPRAIDELVGSIIGDINSLRAALGTAGPGPAPS